MFINGLHFFQNLAALGGELQVAHLVFDEKYSGHMAVPAESRFVQQVSPVAGMREEQLDNRLQIKR